MDHGGTDQSDDELRTALTRLVRQLIQEDSTAALMESFFRRVLGAYREGKPIRYSEALRDAKQEIRSRPDQPEWSSSRFWAPFILTGIE